MTFRSPPHDGWYSSTEQQLETHGWVRNGEQYTGGPLPDTAIYTRKTSLGFVVIWEQVQLDGIGAAHVR